ncbi:MAG: chaperone NapD [Gammaproteobacteria bacterium]|nr:chaperone NapD [Gammaproteobacteria bacterium]
MQAVKDVAHISSVIVHCLPQRFDQLLQRISMLDCCEIGAHNGSDKLIPILEMATESGILDTLREIEAMEGVISATMVYHQIDEEDEEVLP